MNRMLALFIFTGLALFAKLSKADEGNISYALTTKLPEFRSDSDRAQMAIAATKNRLVKTHNKGSQSYDQCTVSRLGVHNYSQSKWGIISTMSSSAKMFGFFEAVQLDELISGIVSLIKKDNDLHADASLHGQVDLNVLQQHENRFIGSKARHLIRILDSFCD